MCGMSQSWLVTSLLCMMSFVCPDLYTNEWVSKEATSNNLKDTCCILSVGVIKEYFVRLIKESEILFQSLGLTYCQSNDGYVLCAQWTKRKVRLQIRRDKLSVCCLVSLTGCLPWFGVSVYGSVRLVHWGLLFLATVLRHPYLIGWEVSFSQRSFYQCLSLSKGL